MPYAWTNGFRTWYETAGPPVGPVVVLMHGHTFDRTMWTDQVPVLADRFRVVAFDVRGHGRSEVPASGYWAACYADDLLALLDELAVHQPAVLVGNSVGGSTVAHVALAHPQRVAALVLSSASLGSREVPAERELHWRMWEVTAARGIQASLEEAWLPSHIFAGARRRPEVLARIRQMCLAYSGQGFRDPGRAKANADQALAPLYERLADIAAPTLVVHGELDGPDVHAVGERAERDLPGSERVVIAGAGHLSNMEEPVTYNRILLDFLSRRLQAS
jgi:pimeloyl-ACP methyl ester carboxylesterase